MIGKRIRHFSRYRDITAVLARHGFGFLIEEMGLLNMLSFPRRLFTEKEAQDPHSLGERIRRVCEELGPTFIKIGQLASTRPDLIPENIVSELEKLQDKVPPFTFAEAQAILEEELGAKLEEIFREFTEIPLAAASIGQVYAAVLSTGERVAVKVQRPQIVSMIETDLEILHDLASLAERRLVWANLYQIGDMVEEFARSLRAELDYMIEGRNAEKIARQFGKDPRTHIPKIYWDFTTKKILTMEFVQGVKLNDIEKLLELGYSCKSVAEHVIKIIFQQILIEGFFHGDPHPGNIFVLPGEVISLIDFGMVGRLTPDMKYHFASIVIAMMRQDTDAMIQAVLKMGIVPDDVNMPLLRRDVEELREKYMDVPLSKIHLGEAINDLFHVAFHHRIRLPSDLTLVGKSLLTLEGIVERLDPDLSIIKIAAPFGRQLLKERFKFSTITDKLWHNLTEYGDLLIDLPKQSKELIRNIQKGRLHIEIGIPELDIFLKKLDRISNQISFSIVLLSFSIVMMGMVIASSLGNQPVMIWRIPAMDLSFTVAGLMFLWLLFSIFRSGKF